MELLISAGCFKIISNNYLKNTSAHLKYSFCSKLVLLKWFWLWFPLMAKLRCRKVRGSLAWIQLNVFSERERVNMQLHCPPRWRAALWWQLQLQSWHLQNGTLVCGFGNKRLQRCLQQARVPAGEGSPLSVCALCAPVTASRWTVQHFFFLQHFLSSLLSSLLSNLKMKCDS